MFKHKNICMMSVLASAVALSACQPQKAEPQPEQEKATAEAPDQSMKLIGDSEELSLSIPNCDGNSCPEITIERLNTNQQFIDSFIDNEILKQLGQILSVEPAQDRTQAAGSEVEARCMLRYRNDIDSTMQISHNGRRYNIDGDPMPDNRSGREYMTLMLKSV